MRGNDTPNKKLEPRGLIACSSLKGMKPKNEDRHRVAHLGRRKVLLIADGVTNSRFGGEAAQIVVNAFYEEIEQAGILRKRITVRVLKKAYQRAVEKLSEAALERLGEKEGFETSIIGVIEAKNKFLITYLGDGRVYLVRGDLEQGIQLMVTHRKGSGLGGALGPYGLTGQPVYVEHSKSFNSGEIIIAGSDGAFEAENTGSKSTVIQVLAKLRERDALLDDSSLEQAIDALLQDISKQSPLSDDATLGIIVSDKAHRTLRGEVYDSNKHKRWFS